MNAEQPASPRLLRRTIVLGVLTLLSRLLGFLRESVFAALMGASAAADAFFVAFRLPNLVRQLLADGILHPAALPVLTPSAPDAPAFRHVLSRLTGTLGLGLLGLTALGMLGAPLLILLLAPGFADDDRQWQLAAELLQWTLPYLWFGSLGALATAALLAQRRDWLVGLAPLLPNLALIAVPLLLAGTLLPVLQAAAMGLLIGGVLQLLLPLWALAHLGWLSRPVVDWRDPQVRQFLHLLWPTLLSGLTQQLNTLVGTLLASFLVAGSVSWLYLAERLLQFPQGIIGGALAAVLLQHLIASATRSDATEQLRLAHAWAIRLSWWLGMPAALALCLLAEPLVWTVFGYGRFQPADVAHCAVAAAAMGLGLPAHLLARVRSSARQAAQDRRTPLTAALLSAAVNALLGIATILLLPDAGALPAHAGIALAAAAASWTQWGWLGRHHTDPPAFTSRQRGATWLATLVLATCWLWLPSHLPPWQDLHGGMRLLQTLVVLGVGVLMYGLTLRAAGVRLQDCRGP